MLLIIVKIQFTILKKPIWSHFAEIETNVGAQLKNNNIVVYSYFAFVSLGRTYPAEVGDSEVTVWCAASNPITARYILTFSIARPHSGVQWSLYHH
jgi:hypothetical protein